MSDLRTRILAEIDKREGAAREAVAVGCEDWGVVREHPEASVYAVVEMVDGIDVGQVASCVTRSESDYIALHDPADALRRYAAARRVVERHVTERRVYHDHLAECSGCGWSASVLATDPLPDCPDLLDVAASLGIEVIS